MGERRTGILDAACRVIAKRGVRGLRVEEIAREAGVSVALIYYHFQNREVLLRRVLEHANDRAGAYTRRDLAADRAASARERIERKLQGEFQDDPGVAENSAVWGEVAASAVFEPALRDAVRAGNERWVGAIEELIRQGQADGSIPPALDGRAAAERLVALTDGLSGRWLAGLLPTADAHRLLRGAVAAEFGPATEGVKGESLRSGGEGVRDGDGTVPASSPSPHSSLHPLSAASSPERSATPSVPSVVAVASSPAHTFSKSTGEGIRLLAGLGVAGDAHAGETVRHRSRVARDPSQPNLRQVHLIHAELHDELRAAGFDVAPGQMGENVTTRGVDLLGLPTGTRLRLGTEAVVEVTGLRNPCAQLDGLQPGLMAAVLDRDADGTLIRKAGVMAVVLAGGEVRPGDPIAVELPAAPHLPLAPV